MHQNRLETLERRKKNVLEKIMIESPSKVLNANRDIVIQSHSGKGDNIGRSKIKNNKKTIWDKFFWPVVIGIIVGLALYSLGIK
ncbi:MAG: hypothetical protein HYV51_01820 [Parcubacteria group bacterium]|nr:hypothetical protein [Parcubacteria group bacterium]